MAAELNTDFEQDPELRAMHKVVSALRDLDVDAQNRVLEYVERRLGLQRQQSRRPSLHAPTETSEGVRDERRIEAYEQERHAAIREEGQEDRDVDGLEGISPIARKWMQRNGLSPSQLSSLYSLGVDEIDLVASKVPGKSAREKLHNLILLVGIASYLSSGAARIENEKLKEAIRHYDADVGGNFPSYLKNWASEISGSRSAGDLTLTTRGLNAAKDLIKQMTASKAAER